MDTQTVVVRGGYVQQQQAIREEHDHDHTHSPGGSVSTWQSRGDGSRMSPYITHRLRTCALPFLEQKHFLSVTVLPSSKRYKSLRTPRIHIHIHPQVYARGTRAWLPRAFEAVNSDDLSINRCIFPTGSSLISHRSTQFAFVL